MEGRLHRWDGDREPVHVWIAGDEPPAEYVYVADGTDYRFEFTGLTKVIAKHYADYANPTPAIQQLEPTDLTEDEELDYFFNSWGEGARRDFERN